MAFTVSVTALGNGTLSVGVTAAPAGTASWTSKNITTSGPVRVVNSNGGVDSVSGPQLAVSNTIQFKAYSGANATGSLLATTTGAATAFVTNPTVSVQINGSSSGCTWSAASESNSEYSFTRVDLYYRINGGAQQAYGSSFSQSGSIPNTSVNVGYSSSITWQVYAFYTSGTFGSYSNTNTATGNTGAAPTPPPAAPNPATGLTATDNTTNIVLNWTASSGGATGYQIARSGTVIGTTAGVTYTDSSPGAARPITYTVTAYNTNAGGTTYGSGTAVTVPAAGGGTVTQRQQMIL